MGLGDCGNNTHNIYAVCLSLPASSHLSTQSWFLSETNLKNVLSSTLVQISGKAMTSTSADPTLDLVSLEQEAMQPLRGSVVPVLGPRMETRSSGSSVHVQHVTAICSACVQSSVNNTMTIISADCQHAVVRGLFFFPLAILIRSSIFPVTSDCKADEASWQRSLQQFLCDILSHCGPRVFSHLWQR